MVNTRKALGALVIFLACFSFHVRNPRGIGSENVSRQAQIRAQSWKRKHFEPCVEVYACFGSFSR